MRIKKIRIKKMYKKKIKMIDGENSTIVKYLK